MKLSLPLCVSLCIVSLLVGLTAGYALSPGYQNEMDNRETMGLGQPDRWFDARYIDAMAIHHRAAMLLAEQAKAQSTRHDIQALSSEILTGEPKLIEELYSWKRQWYGDTRQNPDPVVANLSTYDEKFDLRLLNALIAHHEAGIAMTQETRTKSSTKEILNNADAVENFLTNSLVTLTGWRKDWYKVE